ncbi:MAG: tRNA pseudouridine(55) synthase TruB [Gammaproteobacteria bacterium]|nr:MAG: tRNA pseudouridine(55) synthase TruB [Gammaproteobacteria bacterium]
MGRRGRLSKGQHISGILLLDKGTGRSSNSELQRAKSIFNARKAGHTGSLDPLASGLLPICFGEATKVSAYLLDGDKRYQVKVRLGVVTDSGDKEGAIISEKPVPLFTQADLGVILKGFEGEISQVPPMYSALKHNGERLYKLARKGLEVERKARKIIIHELHLTGFDEASLELDVLCSKGTYIRTLAEDIGKKMGCGAHVEILRRTEVNCFNVENAFSLGQLEALSKEGGESLMATLLPVDAAISEWPKLNLSDSLAWHIKQGQAVECPDVRRERMEGLVRMYDASYGFIGLGKIDDAGRLAPKRLFNL